MPASSHSCVSNGIIGIFLFIFSLLSLQTEWCFLFATISSHMPFIYDAVTSMPLMSICLFPWHWVITSIYTSFQFYLSVSSMSFEPQRWMNVAVLWFILHFMYVIHRVLFYRHYSQFSYQITFIRTGVQQDTFKINKRYCVILDLLMKVLSTSKSVYLLFLTFNSTLFQWPFPHYCTELRSHFSKPLF